MNKRIIWLVALVFLVSCQDKVPNEPTVETVGDIAQHQPVEKVNEPKEKEVIQPDEHGITDIVAKELAAEKAAAEKAAAEKAAAEKAAVEKAAVEKAAVEKAAVEKAAVEKAAVAPATKVVAPLTQGKGPIRSEPKVAPKGVMLKESLGDAIAGEKVAKKCKSCHTFNQGGKKKTGPNLFGIVGREKGSVAGFKYGSYLASIGGVWDETSLKAWLADSKGVAKAVGKKSKMPSQKIRGVKADDLIAYLKTLK